MHLASSVAASQVCPLSVERNWISPGPDHSIDELLKAALRVGLDRIYGFVRGVVMSTIVIHRRGIRLERVLPRRVKSSFEGGLRGRFCLCMQSAGLKKAKSISGISGVSGQTESGVAAWQSSMTYISLPISVEGRRRLLRFRSIVELSAGRSSTLSF